MGSYLLGKVVEGMEPMLEQLTKIYLAYSRRVLTFITDI
ncbi:hypothetical protein EMIT0373P_10267 [Pseudomonas chlororaphis]|nr:hypothetical protein U724_00815 [Pseudomonas chlororaphis subsp. aurantiaca PB-St2]